METITWSASNAHSYLNGQREAATMWRAIRDAKRYANNELGGEGTITIYQAGRPVRKMGAGLLFGTGRCSWINLPIG